MTYGFSSSDMLYSWLKYKHNEECKKNFGVLFPSINPSVKLLPTVHKSPTRVFWRIISVRETIKKFIPTDYEYKYW